MCFFSKPDIPAAPKPIPAPAPAPIPTPEQISPLQAQDASRKRLQQSQQGLASTIFAGRGIFGKKPELSSSSGGKTKLG